VTVYSAKGADWRAVMADARGVFGDEYVDKIRADYGWRVSREIMQEMLVDRNA
jgi:hypothetical protein